MLTGKKATAKSKGRDDVASRFLFRCQFVSKSWWKWKLPFPRGLETTVGGQLLGPLVLTPGSVFTAAFKYILQCGSVVQAPVSGGFCGGLVPQASYRPSRQARQCHLTVVTPDPLQRAASSPMSLTTGQQHKTRAGTRYVLLLPGQAAGKMPRLCRRISGNRRSGPSLLSAQFFEVGGAVVIDGTWTVRYPSIDLHLHPCYGIRQLSPQSTSASATQTPTYLPTQSIASHFGGQLHIVTMVCLLFSSCCSTKVAPHCLLGCSVGLLLCTTVYSRVPGLDCLSHPTLYTQAN